MTETRSSGAAPDDPEAVGQAEVTRLLAAWNRGDTNALDQLLPLVYDELRRLASRSLRGEGAGHTLQTTALVHEAYVRLVGADVQWEDGRHFRAVAASAMRRVLVDQARKRNSLKRGGGQPLVRLDSLEHVLPAPGRGSEALLDLDEALERLLALDERKGRAVELHYFGGLSYEEIAEALEISPATVHRDLRMARAWLFAELDGGEAEHG